MNHVIPARRPVRHLWWLIPLTLFIVVPTLLAAGVFSCLSLRGEARTLRDSLGEPPSLRCQKKIELSIGPGVFGAARLGISFLDVEPEIRAALGSVRALTVGVYELQNRGTPPSKTGLLASADQAMDEHGWERMIVVMNRDELIAIYTPRDTTDTGEIELCLAVVHHHEIVIVSGRADPTPLLEFALDQAEPSANLQFRF
ncbi:MAG: hypothetical protein K9N62_10260 [Verrucomicrobia bacterium]|nr:hypothetical protein [Verrucomicrobiota bacterium]